MHLFLVLLLSFGFLYGRARGVVVSADEVIEPFGNFTPILATGEETVYERWMYLCAADSKCSELYGLSETTNLMQFIHLITLTSPFPGDPLYSENALVYNIYGKTPEELEEQILVDQMKLGILCSNFVCGVNEKPVVTNGTVKCSPLPGRSPSDHNLQDVIIKILISAGSVLLLVYVIKTAYAFSKDSWNISVQAFIQTNPQPPSSFPFTEAGASITKTIPERVTPSGSTYPTQRMFFRTGARGSLRKGEREMEGISNVPLHSVGGGGRGGRRGGEGGGGGGRGGGRGGGGGGGGIRNDGVWK